MRLGSRFSSSTLCSHLVTKRGPPLPGCGDAHHRVRFFREPQAGLRRSYRNRDNDRGGFPDLNGPDGRQDRRPGGCPLVYEDHRAPLHLNGPPSAPVGTLSPLQLACPFLRLVREAELPDEEHVQRSPEGQGDLQSHANTPRGQSNDDWVN